ncbi:hypothetical protein A2U01_0118923, partial [Trifolium medium]|nr:hypothetical protein [Trifolium medium]
MRKAKRARSGVLGQERRRELVRGEEQGSLRNRRAK